MKLGKMTTFSVVLRVVGVVTLLGLLMASAMTTAAQTEEAVGLRIVHVGIDTPPVNVSINGEAVAESLFWLEATEYMEFPAGDHEIAIFDPDTSLDQALSTIMVTTEAGNNYSAVITGEMPEPSIILITDGDEASVEAGMGALRFFHSVPDAGPVDIATSDGTMLAEGVQTMTASAYVMVAPGEYDIDFRQAGTENVLYTEAGITIEDGAFQTTYLSGLAELTNFAAETFVDEYRESPGGGAEPTATEEPQTTATAEPEATATTAPEATATPEPAPTATAVPEVGMPSTGAGGAAPDAGGAHLPLFGAMAVLLLATGGGLLFWTRRVT